MLYGPTDKEILRFQLPVRSTGSLILIILLSTDQSASSFTPLIAQNECILMTWARRICAYIVKCLKIGSEVGGIIKLSILKIGNDEFKFANK